MGGQEGLLLPSDAQFGERVRTNTRVGTPLGRWSRTSRDIRRRPPPLRPRVHPSAESLHRMEPPLFADALRHGRGDRRRGDGRVGLDQRHAFGPAVHGAGARLLGMVVWPGAIAFRHGYRRSEIGLGISTSCVRSCGPGPWSWWPVLCPPGSSRSIVSHEFTLYALLKLVVVAVPFAVLLSLAARFVTRRVLPSLQENGPRGPQRGRRRQLRRGPPAQRKDPEGAVRDAGGRGLPPVRRAARDR